MMQHNLITLKFRDKNPFVESAFSLWGMRLRPDESEHHAWKGFKNLDSLFDAGILSKNTIFAGGGTSGIYPLEQNRHVVGKGYRYGIWIWRTLDMECRGGLHVHTQYIEDYFRKIPSEASEILEFISLDDLSHFLNLSNLYVAGQLTWNPEKDASQLLREFTRGLYGPENEEKMASVYESVEKAACFLHMEYLLGKHLEIFENASERLKLIQKARKTIKEVEISPDFTPVFPLVLSYDELFKEIEAQLAVMETL